MAKTSVYLPDDLAEQVRELEIPISEVTQTALRQEVAARTRQHELKGSEMKRIVVPRGNHKVSFVGRWIADDENNALWSVALTQQGRLALWVDDAGVDGPTLTVFDDYPDMAANLQAEEIVSAVAAMLGQDYVAELDI